MHLLAKSFTVQNDDSELAVVKTWKMCPQLNEHLLFHLPQVRTAFFAPSKQPTTSFKQSSRPPKWIRASGLECLMMFPRCLGALHLMPNCSSTEHKYTRGGGRQPHETCVREKNGRTCPTRSTRWKPTRVDFLAQQKHFSI